MGSKDIRFSELSDATILPGTYGEFNLKARAIGLPENSQEILVLAQGLAAGTVDELTPTDVYSDTDASTFFGAGSIVHLTVQAILDKNPRAKIKVCSVDDEGAAVAADGAFTIEGTATGAGSLSLYIGNVRVTISGAKDDSDTALATAAISAINEKVAYLPVTCAVDVGDDSKVNLTAKNKGTLGNQLKLSAVCTIPGITVTPTAMSNGATDPDLGAVSGVLDTVYPGDYPIYCSAFNDDDNLGDIKAHIDEIAGPNENRGALCVSGGNDLTGNISAIKTKCGTTVNHWRTTFAYIKGTRSLPYEIAGAYAGAIASKSDPAANLDDEPLPGIHVPDITDQYSETEKEDLIKSGVTPLHVIPGNQAAICMAVTTHTQDTQGNPDSSLRDISKPRIADYGRKYLRTRLSTRFKQVKNLQRVKDEIREDVIEGLYTLEEAEVIEGVAAWEDHVLVQDDLVNAGRVNVRVPMDGVVPLHVIAMLMDLL